jgi:hypothetical protein
MLDLRTGVLDFGNDEELHFDTLLATFEQTEAAARLEVRDNPHVAELREFHGWHETFGPLKFNVSLIFREGRISGIHGFLSHGPMSPFDWNRVTEQMLKDEIRVLTRFVESQLGRPADRDSNPFAPAFGKVWDMPWGTVVAAGEPRSFTCGIYLTPR